MRRNQINETETILSPYQTVKLLLLQSLEVLTNSFSDWLGHLSGSGAETRDTMIKKAAVYEALVNVFCRINPMLKAKGISEDDNYRLCLEVLYNGKKHISAVKDEDLLKTFLFINEYCYKAGLTNVFVDQPDNTDIGSD